MNHHEDLYNELVTISGRRSRIAGEILASVTALEKILTPAQAADLSFILLKDSIHRLVDDIKDPSGSADKA
jgi:hypothetical protein